MAIILSYFWAAATLGLTGKTTSGTGSPSSLSLYRSVDASGEGDTLDEDMVKVE